MPNATTGSPRKTPRDCGPAAVRHRLRQRAAWLRQIAPTGHFHQLFDYLPGIHFFAKNRRGELMFLSRSQQVRYGLRQEHDAVGLTDFDLNPSSMAAGYVADDAHIYRTGEPLVRRVELWWDAQGIPDWYQVTKLPIRSHRGRIIGIMGVLQRYEGAVHPDMPWREIDAAVRHLREHFRGPVPVADLAQRTGLSARQLQRKFREILGTSPQEFLIKTRVLAACHALRHTTASLANIAADCGFCDQSSFTNHFRHHVGQTPRAFRHAVLRV